MTTATPKPKVLTSDQVEFFEREGYLVVDDLFEAEELQPVIDELTNEIHARACKLVEAGELSRTYEELDFEHRLAAITEETDKVIYGIWSGQLHGPEIFNLIRHPRLLDLAEDLVGPEIVASSAYRVRPKIPHFQRGEVPWHQDSGYFEPYCDKSLILTVWIPLVDADAENGCLWVIPKHHRQGVLKHYRRPAGKGYLEICKEAMPSLDPVCVPVRKGGVLLLTNLAPHASFANRSDVVRWSLDFRYQSAFLPNTAVPQDTAADEDRDDEMAVPVSCYPPEADFLVRSRERPDLVIQDADSFRTLRENHQPSPLTQRWGEA